MPPLVVDRAALAVFECRYWHCFCCNCTWLPGTAVEASGMLAVASRAPYWVMSARMPEREWEHIT